MPYLHKPSIYMPNMTKKQEIILRAIYKRTSERTSTNPEFLKKYKQYDFNP